VENDEECNEHKTGIAEVIHLGHDGGIYQYLPRKIYLGDEIAV